MNGATARAWVRALSPALALALGACGSTDGATAGTTAPAGTCAVDANGNYVCADYAPAYPYDYAYTDPFYGTTWGYYPYAVDTYYDPLGYDVSAFELPAAALALPAGPRPTTGSDVPELLDKAHRAADAVNAGIRAALDPIRDLLRTPPVLEGDSLVFGPADHGGASYRLTLRLLSQADQRYGWRLEVRPPGASGDFSLAAGGLIRVGDQPRRGHGVIGVDCDAISAADASVTCKGRLLEGFAHDGDDKILQLRLSGFSADGATVAPLDAAVFAWRHGFETNAVRLVLRTNLASTATSAPETLAIKLRWRKDAGARADAVATGGDLSPGQPLRVSTCVSADLRETDSCAATLEAADEPAAEPMATDPPAGMPEMPDPPQAIPDGTP